RDQHTFPTRRSSDLDGDVLEQRNRQAWHPHTRQASEVLAEKSAEAVAQQGQNEANGHLALAQGQAAKSDDGSQQRADRGPSQKAQPQVAGQVGGGKAGHGRQKQTAIQREVDHAGPLAERLAAYGNNER